MQGSESEVWRRDELLVLRRVVTNSQTKICPSCGRTVEFRARWARVWDSVRYCSKACRRRKISATDRALERTIVSLLASRVDHASLCPSEVARAVRGDGDWRALMEPTRRAARRLAHAGVVEIIQRGKIVDAAELRGPIRIRLARHNT